MIEIRRQESYAETVKMLDELGFRNYNLLMGLNSSSRMLINDYNDANPHPRAIAINIKRDSDNLKDFLCIFFLPLVFRYLLTIQKNILIICELCYSLL